MMHFLQELRVVLLALLVLVISEMLPRGQSHDIPVESNHQVYRNNPLGGSLNGFQIDAVDLSFQWLFSGQH